MAAAIHTLDNLLQAPNPVRSIEATVMLASLRAFPRPGISSSDVAHERALARELFDRVAKNLETEDMRANGHAPSRASRIIGEDQDMHVDIARLWQGENLDRTGRALKEALKISEGSGKTDPRLLNNLGVLQHLDQKLPDARQFYENALVTLSGMGPEAGEGVSTSVLYNLARVYEDQGEDTLAKDAYDKLLTRHPEYVDGNGISFLFLLNSTDAYRSQNSTSTDARRRQPEQRSSRVTQTIAGVAKQQSQSPRVLHPLPHADKPPKTRQRLCVRYSERSRQARRILIMRCRLDHVPPVSREPRDEFQRS